MSRRKIPKQSLPAWASVLTVEDILTVSGVRSISREGLHQVAALVDRVPMQVIILLLQEGFIR